MNRVHLTGLLVCHGDDEVAVVTEHLARHVALTRAEEGCISFDVTRSDDPLVWRVDEWFRDAAAFASHQERVAHSEWGRSTVGIERRYVTEGA
ncbi:putative quinol monooxygenase [Leekyejoonella antrihumi]|uniref:putative quinol monooxygenase n=1 Tax=Leekyejoonella antrihumi TaxID=1660198 RepID=UPI001C981E4B|nr:antibiotic biosynthesis monooxygenase [Leekyejoonella antrihumi]